jgi:hypothetical protein
MKRLFVALIIPILLVSLGGLGLSHFTAGTAVRIGLGTAWLKVGFKCYKYRSPWSCQVSAPDCYTLQVSTQIFPGWYCWIGLVLENFGTDFGVDISPPTYTITGGDRSLSTSFVHNEYFYGPWNENSVPNSVYASVWVPNVRDRHAPAGAVLPPSPGSVPAPVYLQPYGSGGGSNPVDCMVLWIFLQYPRNALALHSNTQLVITPTCTCAPPPCKTSSATWQAPKS